MSPSSEILPTNPPPQGTCSFKVNSPNVIYTPDFIHSKYIYHNTIVEKDETGKITSVTPTETAYEFQVNRNIPKVG